jgi:hypothetical protein
MDSLLVLLQLQLIVRITFSFLMLAITVFRRLTQAVSSYSSLVPPVKALGKSVILAEV